MQTTGEQVSRESPQTSMIYETLLAQENMKRLKRFWTAFRPSAEMPSGIFLTVVCFIVAVGSMRHIQAWQMPAEWTLKIWNTALR